MGVTQKNASRHKRTPFKANNHQSTLRLLINTNSQTGTVWNDLLCEESVFVLAERVR